MAAPSGSTSSTSTRRGAGVARQPGDRRRGRRGGRRAGVVQAGGGVRPSTTPPRSPTPGSPASSWDRRRWPTHRSSTWSPTASRSRSASTTAAAWSRCTAGRRRRRSRSPTGSIASPAASAFVITDIERDGVLAGPDVVGLAAAVAATTTPVIASGGVSSLDDVRALAGDPRARRHHHRPGALRGPLHGRRGDRCDRRDHAVSRSGTAPPMRAASASAACEAERQRSGQQRPAWPGNAMNVAQDHSLSRRDRRAGGQRDEVRRPARRRRRRRARRALRRRGRRRARVPRHHGVERRARHDDRRWSAGWPRRCSSRSPSAAGSAPLTTPGACCAPAPTRSPPTRPRSSAPSCSPRSPTEFGAQCAVCAIDAKRRDAADPAAGGGVPARRAHADRARRRGVGGAGGRARRRRDPAHVDGPRRHGRRVRPRAHRVRSPTRSACR